MLITDEDREWIDTRADQLFRESERQRGGIRHATVMPQDFRDYFVVQAAWERFDALTRKPIPTSIGSDWQWLEQEEQPRLSDGYTAVRAVAPGKWMVRGAALNQETHNDDD